MILNFDPNHVYCGLQELIYNLEEDQTSEEVEIAE